MTLRTHTFTYAYKSSDGVRHVDEIVAPTRDDAFAELRKQGIRPIKVVEKDAGKRQIRNLTLAGLLLVIVAAGTAWVVASRYHADKPQISSTVAVAEIRKAAYYAKPLPRQPLQGDAKRRALAYSNGFEHVSESFLARFAEPGAEVSDPQLTDEIERDFSAALKSYILITDDEYTESVDLKRIVCGMKREMRAYLAGGGTIRGYVDELVKRQEIERSLREKVERRVRELIAVNSDETSLRRAFDYLLKANASLRTRGIEPLAIPPELMGLDRLTDLDLE